MALARDFLSDGNRAVTWHPGKLWSSWDMLKPYAHDYLKIGQKIYGSGIHLIFIEDAPKNATAEEKAEKQRQNEESLASVKAQLTELRECCIELDLPVSMILIDEKIKDPPKSFEAYHLVISAIGAEIKSKQFLFVPPHLAKYHDLILPSTITIGFPLASKELVAAGNCLSAGLSTACVFHAMRAAEIGVRVLGNELDVKFPDKPLELAEWQNILDQADSKIVAMKELPRGTKKDEELGFFSQASVQFRYFKDAWRVRVAHARETYEEMQATRVLNHTLEFFETIAIRLKEPKPSV